MLRDEATDALASAMEFNQKLLQVDVCSNNIIAINKISEYLERNDSSGKTQQQKEEEAVIPEIMDAKAKNRVYNLGGPLGSSLSTKPKTNENDKIAKPQACCRCVLI